MQTKFLDTHGKAYNRTLLLALLLVGTFCTVLNQTILSTALPKIMTAFDISTATGQWLTTGFLLVNGIMIPISAWLFTNLSSKVNFIAAMVLFIVGTTLCWTAPNFAVLLIGRLIQAAGTGISLPIMQLIILTIFPPDKRGAAMGMSGIVVMLAPAIGPTLAGWIVDNYSWRILFGIMIPIALVVLVLSFFFMKSVLPQHKQPLDTLSVLLSTAGFGTLLYGFSSAGNEGWGDPVVLSCIVVGILLLALFTHRQLHMDKPFLDVRVFKASAYTVATIVYAITNMALIGAEMILPLFIQNVLGESAFSSGLILLPGSLVMSVIMIFSGVIYDHRGAKHLAIAGMSLLTFATVPFIFITVHTTVTQIVVLYILRMIGVALIMMPVSTAAMDALSVNLLSHGTAILNTLSQVASSVGTAILVSVLANTTADAMPRHALLKTAPLLYQHDAIAAALTGDHAAFAVAVLFSLIGLGLTFRIKSKPSQASELEVPAK